MDQRNDSMKNKRWLVTLMSIGLGMLLFACQSQQPAGTASLKPGKIVKVVRGDLATNVNTTGQIQTTQRASLSFANGGKVEAVNVQVGDEVKEGDLLATLETMPLKLAFETAQQAVIIEQENLELLKRGPSAEEIKAAESAVASACAYLDQLVAGPSDAEVAAKEADLRAQEANVWSATASLGQAQDVVRPEQILAAEAQVADAQNQLLQIENATKNGSNEEAHKALLNAQEALSVAQARLDALVAGPNRHEVSAAQANVAVAMAQQEAIASDTSQALSMATSDKVKAAENQLAQAISSLDALLNSTTAQQFEIAKIKVAQAEANVFMAEANLKRAVLIAPFSGTITAVKINVGDSAIGDAITIVNLNALEVVLNVSEVDIGQVSVGQKAKIQIEAWPNEWLNGVIRAIAPVADSGNRVKYALHVDIEPSDRPIRIGMTATANLVVAEQKGVLLVPNQAVVGNSVNLVQADGSIQSTPVTIGLRDSKHTQILEGLTEGDRVTVGGQTVASVTNQ